MLVNHKLTASRAGWLAGRHDAARGVNDYLPLALPQATKVDLALLSLFLFLCFTFTTRLITRTRHTAQPALPQVNNDFVVLYFYHETYYQDSPQLHKTLYRRLATVRLYT